MVGRIAVSHRRAAAARGTNGGNPTYAAHWGYDALRRHLKQGSISYAFPDEFNLSLMQEAV
jgi:hypothetical protein